MKKIAAIFLFLFLLIQVYPAINSFFAKTNTFFVIDTDKGEHKPDSSKNDKKDFLAHMHADGEFSYRGSIASHLDEKLHPSPCLELHTPPPNVS